MADFREILTGTLVDKESGKPLSGATVEVYDKDLLHNDHLGTETTDEGGRFRVSFGWADYKDAFLEGRPDIFIKVTADGDTWKSDVYAELKGKMVDDDTEVFDLGQVEVG
ncbi:MAG: hypothetical protein QNJ90_10050 [Planctomycetota bacterium]|nr:hypothetical protein [Planctomycetota bacterium]